MNKIILIGGGGHCKSVIDVIEQEGKFKIAGIIDKPEFLGSNILNYKVIGNDFDLKNLAKKYSYALITVGQIKSPSIRIKLFKLAKKSGFLFPIIISPKAYVSKYSKIKEGTIVMHGAIINSNVTIGENCIINSNALIEHGVKIGDNCHISTSTTINGEVTIEDEVFVGSGSIIREEIKIKKKSIVPMGTKLFKN